MKKSDPKTIIRTMSTTWYVLDRFGRLLFSGSLAECYEKYPTLACVGIGETTGRGLSLIPESLAYLKVFTPWGEA